jgi:protein-S-isoprenylcysteine O-methyltransferase Ste14|tara:strand:+ start:442 stop:915 length:474 start_codon:yes stop_codon:yes gene_type:complete
MNKEINNDNPGVKIPPPIIFIGFGLFGGLINYLKPLTITGPSWLVYLGVLILIGSFLGFGYMINFYKKNETEIEPTKTTFKIITSGLYRHSRNPVYIILCAGPVGLGFIFMTYWAIFAFIPALIVIYFTAVKKEEQYLEKKFGQEYLDYKKKVRRWI